MFADDVVQHMLAETKYQERQLARGEDEQTLNPYFVHVAERIPNAVRFVFDRESTGASAALSYSNPVAMVEALPLLRLPAPLLWIEFSVKDFAAALEAVKSHTIRMHPQTLRQYSRLGFLIEETATGFRVHMMKREEAGITPVGAHLDFAPNHPAGNITPDMASADLLKQLDAKDLAKLKAYTELLDRHQVSASEDYRAFIAEGIMDEKFDVAEATEFMNHDFRVFAEQLRLIIAFLLLLTVKKGIAYVEPDFTKLNKSRAKSGKLPLLPYKEAKIQLGQRIRRRLEQQFAGVPGGIINHWRNGHFKLRKTGVFWWCGHWAGDESIGTKPARFWVTGTPAS